MFQELEGMEDSYEVMARGGNHAQPCLSKKSQGTDVPLHQAEPRM